MNNIPSIEELDRIGCEAVGIPILPTNEETIKYLTVIAAAVVQACRPQPRPIAEMPAEVPEGCVRVCLGDYPKSTLWVQLGWTQFATHFIDIALPEPDYPADFEQAFAESGLDAKNKAAAFKLWKGGER